MHTELPDLLLLAGSGSYPLLLAEGARAAGVRRIAAAALRGQTSRRLRALVDELRWFGVGELQSMLDWAASLHVPTAVMVGQITPTALFRTRFDPLSRSLLHALRVKSAHTIFGALTGLLAERGLRPIPASCYMERHLPAAGQLSTRGPDARELADIEYGHRVALAIGSHDIGQTIVVKDGMILAVEAFEGTNRAIRRGGRLGGPGAVVVKVARAGHDMRFDIPVIGARTIPVLRRARVRALAIQAGRTILLEREQVVAAANRLGIALVALDSGLPLAPTRPGPTELVS